MSADTSQVRVAESQGVGGFRVESDSEEQSE